MTTPAARFSKAFRRYYCADERGAITVEFVIIFPLVLLLLFLIIFTSLLIATASDVQQIAHELSRQSLGRMARNPSAPDICTEMSHDSVLMHGLTRNSLLIDPAKLVVRPCPEQPDTNGFVSISVSYNFAGSFVQALGQNFGVNLGIIHRGSAFRF